jgi:hypothetical protein
LDTHSVDVSAHSLNVSAVSYVNFTEFFMVRLSGQASSCSLQLQSKWTASHGQQAFKVLQKAVHCWYTCLHRKTGDHMHSHSGYESGSLPVEREHDKHLLIVPAAKLQFRKDPTGVHKEESMVECHSQLNGCNSHVCQWPGMKCRDATSRRQCLVLAHSRHNLTKSSLRRASATQPQ